MPDDAKPTTATNSATLKQFPGEELLAHEGIQWMEHAEAIFAKEKLLSVINGEDPPAAKRVPRILTCDVGGVARQRDPT